MRCSKQDLVNGRNSLRSKGVRISFQQTRDENQLAVYQLALFEVNSFQKTPAENFGGRTMLPPERSGARKAASKPGSRR